MKFTTIEEACQKLREMGAQYIYPKDQFFGYLAEVIEKILTEHKMLGEDLRRETAMYETAANLATEYQLCLERIRDERNNFEGPNLDYMQGYRDGQEHLQKIVRELLK